MALAPIPPPLVREWRFPGTALALPCAGSASHPVEVKTTRSSGQGGYLPQPRSAELELPCWHVSPATLSSSCPVGTSPLFSSVERLVIAQEQIAVPPPQLAQAPIPPP